MADLEFIVEIPVANQFKFTYDGADSDKRASFDQQRFQLARHTTAKREREYKQPVELADPSRVQYYSNYPFQRLRIIDCDENIYNANTGAIDPSFFYTPSVAVSYTNKKYRSDCMFTSINGKLFVYFIEGMEYSDEDFLVTGDLVTLNGVLPDINAKVGDILRYKIGALDFASTPITEIVWVPELEAEGYLTDIDITLLTPVAGLVEVSYDEKPANLYAQLVDFNNLEPGEYFLRLEFGLLAATKTYTTEPLDIQEEHEDSQAIIYRHSGVFDQEDIWNYVYLSDWTNIIRMPANFFKYKPAGEVESDINDSGVPRMTRAVPFRQISFEAFEIPNWLVDKLSIIFSHDSKKINDYYWENDGLGNYEGIGEINLGNFSIDLKQVNDRTKLSNEFVETVTASWTPSSFSAQPFGGAVVQAVFNSNTILPFAFIELPAWITADKATFVNGDTVEFTIAANATAFTRFIELVAVSEDLPGLEAPITFEQLYDDSVPPPDPEFIEVDDETVDLGYAAGSNQQLSVNASGDYTITISGAHSFTAVKENGILNVRISEPTANFTLANRTGTVRLALVSNPAVFVDIAVTQIFRPAEMVSVAPTPLSVPAIGAGTRAFGVTVVGSAQWQATSPAGWASVESPSTIYTGSQFVNVHIQDMPEFLSSRSVTITFYNIANPADYVTAVINQS